MEKYSEDIAKLLEKYTLSLIELGADPSIMSEGFRKETGERLSLDNLNELHPITIIREYDNQFNRTAIIGDFDFHRKIKTKLTTDISVKGKYNRSLDFVDIKTNGFIINSSKVEPFIFFLEKNNIPFEEMDYDDFIELDKKDKLIYVKPLTDNKISKNHHHPHLITLKANCQNKVNSFQKKEIAVNFSFENEHTYAKHKNERFKNFKKIFNKALKSTGHKNMVVCGSIIPSGTPRNNKNIFKVVDHSAGSEQKRSPNLTKNKWGNLEDTNTSLVFSDFKIKKERIVIGKQDKKKTARFKKGILSLLPLNNKDIMTCKRNGWTSLNEEHIDILSRSKDPKHRKIYRELQAISPDEEEIVIDETEDIYDNYYDEEENYFSDDLESYYNYEEFNNDDFDNDIDYC